MKNNLNYWSKVISAFIASGVLALSTGFLNSIAMAEENSPIYEHRYYQDIIELISQAISDHEISICLAQSYRSGETWPRPDGGPGNVNFSVAWQILGISEYWVSDVIRGNIEVGKLLYIDAGDPKSKNGKQNNYRLSFSGNGDVLILFTRPVKTPSITSRKEKAIFLPESDDALRVLSEKVMEERSGKSVDWKAAIQKVGLDHVLTEKSWHVLTPPRAKFRIDVSRVEREKTKSFHLNAESHARGIARAVEADRLLDIPILPQAVLDDIRKLAILDLKDISSALSEAKPLNSDVFRKLDELLLKLPNEMKSPMGKDIAKELHKMLRVVGPLGKR